jgi:hypothetical protein
VSCAAAVAPATAPDATYAPVLYQTAQPEPVAPVGGYADETTALPAAYPGSSGTDYVEERSGTSSTYGSGTGL